MAVTFDREAAEQEANEIAFRFMDSRDVVGDMSRAYHTSFSGIRLHEDDEAEKRVRAAGTDALAKGNDLYFKKGILAGNDQASRGLLAHELAHTMQQGIVAGDVEESAPVGAEQGGPLDWIRRMFGRKKKAQHLGSVKATDEDSLNYIAAMRAREQELQEQKRVNALNDTLATPLSDVSVPEEGLEENRRMFSELIPDSNRKLATHQGTQTEKISEALQALGLRVTGSGIGKLNVALRKQAYDSVPDYVNYLKHMDESGTDFRLMAQNMQEFKNGEKFYRVNEGVNAMSKDLLSIMEKHLSTDAGLTYMDNVIDSIKDADVFTQTNETPMDYLFSSIITGEAGRSTTEMQDVLNRHNFQQTGEDAEARRSLAKEANRNLMLPVLMSSMGEEERMTLPPEIQDLYVQYTGLKERLERALAKRRGGR